MTDRSHLEVAALNSLQLGLLILLVMWLMSGGGGSRRGRGRDNSNSTPQPTPPAPPPPTPKPSSPVTSDTSPALIWINDPRTSTSRARVWSPLTGWGEELRQSANESGGLFVRRLAAELARAVGPARTLRVGETRFVGGERWSESQPGLDVLNELLRQAGIDRGQLQMIFVPDATLR